MSYEREGGMREHTNKQTVELSLETEAVKCTDKEL